MGFTQLKPTRGNDTPEGVAVAIEESLRGGKCSVAVTNMYGGATVYDMQLTEQGARNGLICALMEYLIPIDGEMPSTVKIGQTEITWKANGQEGVLRLTPSPELVEADAEELKMCRTKYGKE